MSEAELVKKATAAILAEIQRRRSASGITGGATPTSPVQRAEPAIKVQPTTVEDQIFNDMLVAGPKKLALNL